MSTTMTVRIEDDVKDRLEKLADATQRSKSFLAAEAIRAFVESNEWQIGEIRQAIKEANADDFAGDGHGVHDRKNPRLNAALREAGFRRARAQDGSVDPGFGTP